MTELNKIHAVFSLTSARGTATARTLTPNGAHLVDELLTAKTIEKPSNPNKAIQVTLSFLEKQNKPFLTLHEIISTKRLPICDHIGDLSFVIRDPIDIFISRSKNSTDPNNIISAIVQNSHDFQTLNNYLLQLPDNKWEKVKHIVDTTKIGSHLFSGVAEVTLSDNIFSMPSDNNSSITEINHTFYYPSEENSGKVRAVSIKDIQKKDLSPELKKVKLLKGDAFKTRGLRLTNKSDDDDLSTKRNTMKNFIELYAEEPIPMQSAHSHEIIVKNLGQCVADAKIAYNNIKILAKKHNVLRSSLEE